MQLELVCDKIWILSKSKVEKTVCCQTVVALLLVLLNIKIHRPAPLATLTVVTYLGHQIMFLSHYMMFEVNGSVRLIKKFKLISKDIPGEMVCKSTNLPTRHFLGLQRKHRSKWNNANKLRLEQTLYSNGQLLCHVTLTLWWGEEVEKGVVGDRFGDRPDRATALVLLFLFDCFQCDVLALCPFNRAAVVKNKEQWKQGQEAAFEVSNLKNIWDVRIIQ